MISYKRIAFQEQLKSNRIDSNNVVWRSINNNINILQNMPNPEEVEDFQEKLENLKDVKSNTYLVSDSHDIFDSINNIEQIYRNEREVLFFSMRGLVSEEVILSKLNIETLLEQGIIKEKDAKSFLSKYFSEAQPGYWYLKDNVDIPEVNQSILSGLKIYNKLQDYLYVPTNTDKDKIDVTFLSILKGEKNAGLKYAYSYIHTHYDKQGNSPTSDYMQFYQFSPKTDTRELMDKVGADTAVVYKNGYSFGFADKRVSALKDFHPFIQLVKTKNQTTILRNYLEFNKLFQGNNYARVKYMSLAIKYFMGNLSKSDFNIALQKYLHNFTFNSKQPINSVDIAYIKSVIDALNDKVNGDAKLNDLLCIPENYRELQIIDENKYSVFISDYQLDRIKTNFQKSGFKPTLAELIEYIKLTSIYFRELEIRQHFPNRRIPKELVELVSKLSTAPDLVTARHLASQIKTKVSELKQ